MQTIEQMIITRMLEKAGKRGLTPVHVNIGDGETIQASTIAQVIDAVNLVDQSHIILMDRDGKRHWVFVVLGNGVDVLIDYGVCIELDCVFDELAREQP